MQLITKGQKWQSTKQPLRSSSLLGLKRDKLCAQNLSFPFLSLICFNGFGFTDNDTLITLIQLNSRIVHCFELLVFRQLDVILMIRYRHHHLVPFPQKYHQSRADCHYGEDYKSNTNAHPEIIWDSGLSIEFFVVIGECTICMTLPSGEGISRKASDADSGLTQIAVSTGFESTFPITFAIRFALIRVADRYRKLMYQNRIKNVSKCHIESVQDKDKTDMVNILKAAGEPMTTEICPSNAIRVCIGEWFSECHHVLMHKGKRTWSYNYEMNTLPLSAWYIYSIITSNDGGGTSGHTAVDRHCRSRSRFIRGLMSQFAVHMFFRRLRGIRFTARP